MKAISIRTLALVGAAALTLGMTAGCSSDDKKDDKATNGTSSSAPATDDKTGEATGGGDFCTAGLEAPEIDMTDPTDFAAMYQGTIDYWENWKAAAPSDVKDDFDVIIDAYKAAADGDVAGLGDITTASQNITDKMIKECS